VTREQAQAKLDAALASTLAEYPARKVRPGPYIGVRMRRLDLYLRSSERPLFGVAFASAAMLILLGAINVAGLSAARTHDRHRELSIRAALGADRRSLIALLLAEAFIIAVVGGGLGVLAAGPLLTIALSILPESLPLLKTPSIDERVLAFAMFSAVIPVVSFTLIPAFTVIRNTRAHRVVASQTVTPRMKGWSRDALLAAESAIGIMLAVLGSLMVASFVVVRQADVGFDPSGLAIVEVGILEPIGPKRAAKEADVFERMRAAPGILDVAIVGGFLLEHLYAGSEFRAPAEATEFFASDVPVSESFFEIAGLRLVQGRYATREEIRTRERVVVVSEETARAYWPNASAVGQILEASNLGSFAVVGVVEEARFGSQDEAHGGEIYLPRSLSSSFQRPVYLLKTAGDPGVAARDVALILRSDIPGAFVRRSESFDQALADSVRIHRFRMVLFSVASGAGLLLLAVGIGGLVATGVARRVREIGVRAALGAQQQRLVRMIVFEYLRPAIAGTAIGLLCSWWVSRLISGFLYEIEAHEPAVWAAAIATLLMVTIVAAWIPGRRAARVDPLVALRYE
jgi:putative ABC transport system permease protein